MRLRQSALIWTAGLIVILIVVLFGIERYRHRFVRTDSDLLRLLPRTDATLFFADVRKLRAGGFLGLIAGAASARDKDYAEFIRQTGFDYTRDVDALAGAASGEQIFFALRGTFEWGRLEEYVRSHGGACEDRLCDLPATTPGRWVSFASIQPDVIALASSSDRKAVEVMRQEEQTAMALPSDAPVWVQLSGALLKSPVQLPLALRIFAISLQAADSAVLALEPSRNSRDAFAIKLDAAYANEAAADTARDQLRQNTNLLKTELGRERRAAGEADLARLLTSGAFTSGRNHVTGRWQVSKALVAQLEPR